MAGQISITLPGLPAFFCSSARSACLVALQKLACLAHQADPYQVVLRQSAGGSCAKGNAEQVYWLRVCETRLQ